MWLETNQTEQMNSMWSNNVQNWTLNITDYNKNLILFQNLICDHESFGVWCLHAWSNDSRWRNSPMFPETNAFRACGKWLLFISVCPANANFAAKTSILHESFFFCRDEVEKVINNVILSSKLNTAYTRTYDLLVMKHILVNLVLSQDLDFVITGPKCGSLHKASKLMHSALINPFIQAYR